MKANKIIILVLAFITSVSFTSCVEDGDYTVPQNLGTEENAEVQKIIADLNNPSGTVKPITVKNLKSLFIAGEATQITQDLVVKGYVTSSDRTGNFFKELFIQDEAENPEAAIKIVLNLNDTYNKFNFGREVYIKLNGLFIGETRTGDGVITIGGVATGSQIDDLSIKQIENQMFRSSVTKEMISKSVKLSEISENNIGMFIKIENAQFFRDIKDSTFGDPDEQFDTQRKLESCSEPGASISLETSSFSTFKFSPLPAKSFTINSVVSKTFNGSDLVLALNDENDITETGERCDPDYLDCSGASGGSTEVFSENFTSFGSFSAEGWDNINVDNTSTDWFIGSFSGNSYGQISAFRSGNANANVWLVTPAIDMDNSTEEELSFEIQANYDNGTNLSVFVSSDYSGDPATATWKPLDAIIPSGPSNSFGSFTKVGPVNISCLTGNIHVGFFYAGSDPSATTRYHLDNVEVTGK